MFLYLGGSLGRKFLFKVSDIMLSGSDIFFVYVSVFVVDVLLEIFKKGLGMIGVIVVDGMLIGVFMDGDLWWIFDVCVDVYSVIVEEVMIKGGKIIIVG